MSYIKIFFLGFLGGIMAWFLLLSLPGSGSLVFNLVKDDLVKYFGEELPLTPTPMITSPDFWQKIASDHAFSTVAIQSFKSGKIVREGSGVVISSDGVLITTFDVISGAEVLQVFYKDKILRALVVKYNEFKNLALLKVDSANMDIARLDRNYQFQPGQDVVVAGKLIELSNPVVFAQRGMISRILFKNIILNTEQSYFLSGAQVINNSGIIVGMVYLRNGAVRLITAEAIDDFVKEYFASI